MRFQMFQKGIKTLLGTELRPWRNVSAKKADFILFIPKNLSLVEFKGQGLIFLLTQESIQTIAWLPFTVFIWLCSEKEKTIWAERCKNVHSVMQEKGLNTPLFASQTLVTRDSTVASSCPQKTGSAGVPAQDWTSWQVPSVPLRNQDCEQDRIERTTSPITRLSSCLSESPSSCL